MKTAGLLFVLLNTFSSSILAQLIPLSVYEGDQCRLTKEELGNKELFNTHTSIGRAMQGTVLPVLSSSAHVDILRIQCNNSEFYLQKPDSSLLGCQGMPILKYFNTHPSHFFSTYGRHYYVTIDPLIQLSAGKQFHNENKLLTNRRGLKVSAGIDQKVYLYSEVTENQYSSYSFVNDFAGLYKAFPGAGFVKSYNSKIFGISSGYDFIVAEGGVNFKASKHIEIQLGHGRNFIGQGIRSLLLSDFSPPQFNLKIQSEWGRFKYVNIFSELSRETRFINDRDHLLGKKYSASHFLSYNITDHWNIGLFESVIFNRENMFELQYLNPIILYRAVEQAVGSPDNELLGFQSHVHIANRITLYGQFILDEFVFNRLLKKNQGWWANKYGFQLGAKYPEPLGVRGLYLQVEYNKVRPYTYSYADSIADYSHYHQALAHPLGSNFSEWVGTIQYEPAPRWFMSISFMNYFKGIDGYLTNYGGNILKSYTTRQSDFNNKTGQGISRQVNQAQCRISYRLFRNSWLDLVSGVRTQYTEVIPDNYYWIEAGFRVYLNYREFLL
ncbi:MAG: hypothetical protein U0V49_03940 [Saprospiraceae bacterium]